VCSNSSDAKLLPGYILAKPSRFGRPSWASNGSETLVVFTTTLHIGHPGLLAFSHEVSIPIKMYPQHLLASKRSRCAPLLASSALRNTHSTRWRYAFGSSTQQHQPRDSILEQGGDVLPVMGKMSMFFAGLYTKLCRWQRACAGVDAKHAVQQHRQVCTPCKTEDKALEQMLI
jgi:hypothetical protein